MVVLPEASGLSCCPSLGGALGVQGEGSTFATLLIPARVRVVSVLQALFEDARECHSYLFGRGIVVLNDEISLLLWIPNGKRRSFPAVMDVQEREAEHPSIQLELDVEATVAPRLHRDPLPRSELLHAGEKSRG